MLRFTKGLLLSGSIGANYIYLAVAQVCRAGLGLVLISMVARYLGVAQFGIFSYAIAFGELFIFLADFGLPTVFIRETAARLDFNDAATQYSNAFVAQLISVGGTYLFILLSSILVLGSRDDRILIQLLGLAVAFGVLAKLNQGVFRVFGQTQFEATAVAFERTLTLLTVSISVWLEGNIHQIALAWVLGSAWGCIFTIWLSHHYFVRFQLSTVSPREIIRFFRQAAPLALASSFSTLKDRAGIIILQAFAGNVALGIFNAAYRLLAPFYLLGVAFQNAVLPVLSHLSAVSDEQLKDGYGTALRFIVVMGFLAQAVVTYVATWAIPLVYGHEFKDSVPILQLLSLTLIPNFGYLVTTSLLIVRKQMVSLTWAWAVTTFTNILLTWLLGHSMAQYGLVCALVVSEAVLFVSTYLIIRLTFVSGEMLSIATKCCSAGIASTAIFFLLGRFGTVIAFLGAGLTYIIALAVSRVVTLKEVKWLASRAQLEVEAV